MRLPPATRDSVPADQRDAFDEVVKGYGSVPRYGPGSVMINVPKAHQKVIALNRHLRNSATVSKKLQELAMLVTAREFDCQYIWNAHAASGRSLGIADAVVDALRDRKELPKLPADEAAVIRFGQRAAAHPSRQQGLVPVGARAAGKRRLGRARPHLRQLRHARDAGQFIRRGSAAGAEGSAPSGLRHQ